MPGAPSFLLSDAHLGPAPEEVERSLLALLARARAEAKSVVLNGDVFDFWFEWRHVMPRTGFRVLAALAGLRQAGVEVLWIAGNHDCWGGDVLRREVGVTYHEGPWRGGGGLRRVALERLRAEPALDLYVFGHSHARTAGRAESGAVYANPGAWLDEPTFLRITPERVEG